MKPRKGFVPFRVTVVVANEKLDAPAQAEGRRITVTLPVEKSIVASQSIQVILASFSLHSNR